MFRRPARHEGSARLVFDRRHDGLRGSAGLPHARGRGGRPRRPARRRPGKHRPRALRARAGARGGRIVLDGQAIARVLSARGHRALGINLVCADRVAESVVPGLSIRENLFLNPCAAGRTLISYLEPRAGVATPPCELGERIGLKPNDPSLPIDWLSGGNQQKVVVGRWLHLKRPGLRLRGSDRRRGRRREGGNLPPVRCRARRRAPPFSSSRPTSKRSPRCATARWCSIADRSSRSCRGDDLCVENLLAAASASVGQVRAADRRAMQSLKSNALEPTRSELAALSRGQAIVRLLPIYGLPILTVLLIAFFSFLLPESFPTAINARSILSDKAIIALLSLAAMVPMMAGRIDLTIGFGIVMWHILAISLQVQYDVPWPLACLIVVLCAGVAGLDQRNARRGRADRLVHRHARHRHDPVRARPLAHRRASGHRSAAAGLRRHQRLVGPRHSDAGGLCAGRWRWCCGSSPSGCRSAVTCTRSAPTRRPRRSTASRCAPTCIGVFVASGLLVGFTGCVLASKLQIGQANVGLDYLLPALVGTFLGSTTIRPGRVNVWGTIVGVLILAVGISGIQQLGGAFFVEPLFNGVTLLVSIALAGFAQRRRVGDDAQAAGGGILVVCSRIESAVAVLLRILRAGMCEVVATEQRSDCERERRRAADGRCVPADGEGLRRQGDRAGHAMDRSDDRPDGAGQEAGRLRVVRSAERRTAGRGRRRAGSGEGRSAGISASSTARARCRAARRRSTRRSR